MQLLLARLKDRIIIKLKRIQKRPQDPFQRNQSLVLRKILTLEHRLERLNVRAEVSHFFFIFIILIDLNFYYTLRRLILLFSKVLRLHILLRCSLIAFDSRLCDKWF